MVTTVFARGALLLAALLVPVFPSPARGEAQGVSLSQAIEHALQNNGDLKAYRAEQGIHDAAAVRAGLLPNPTLDLEGGTGALTGSADENNFAIALSQEFPLAGKRQKRIAVAERELALYRWELAERERALREEVAVAFYDALLAKERVALAERRIALSRQLLEVTGERLAAGDIPELEMTLAKVEVARSEGGKLEVTKGVLKSEARLWTVLGIDPQGTAGVAGKLDEGGAVPQVSSLADLRQLARQNRPDLKALEAEGSRGEAEMALARADKVPNLTAGVALRRDTTTMEIGGIEGKETAYTIGLRLSIPIPLFDRNQAALQEASARRTSSSSRLAAAVRRVEGEVDSAYGELRKASEMVALYQKGIIPQLNENLELTQEAYRLGEVGILAVIEEQKKYAEVSDGYLAALHDRQVALVRLKSATASEPTRGEK